MGTSSLIVARLTNGKWGAIRCGYDGYPQHHRPILSKYYNDQKKIDSLIGLGDLSQFEAKLKFKKKPKDEWELIQGGACITLGKSNALICEALEDVWKNIEVGADWVYIWDGSKWRYAVFDYATSRPRELTTIRWPQITQKRIAPIVSVQPMKTSYGFDYFVAIQVEDRQTTPFVFRNEEWKAAYEADHLKYIFFGGEEPDLLAYGPDGWPGMKS